MACAPAFATPRSRARFPPGPRQLRLKIAAFQYKRSTRSVLLQLGWKIATFKRRRSMRSVHPQLRLKNRTAPTALAQSDLRRVTCAKQLAQSNLGRALAQSTCAEQLAQTNLHRAHAQSACAEQLAQSTCAEQLAQSTCAEQLGRSTCAQQLAESNLRAAARNNAACADHFREKSRGAARAKHVAPSKTCTQPVAQSHSRKVACAEPTFTVPSCARASCAELSCASVFCRNCGRRVSFAIDCFFLLLVIRFELHELYSSCFNGCKYVGSSTSMFPHVGR